MTRMSVASRRFYRAFYEWTLLTSPAEVGAERSCSHGFHSTAAKHKTSHIRRVRLGGQREHGREVLRAPHDERQWSQHFDSPRERTNNGILDAEEKLQFAYEAAIGRPPPKMRELQKYIERWKNAPVHQATDKPFSTLQPWEEVVRYRSEMGIMIEVPVPDQDLERLKGEYRSGLEILVLAFDSRIEVQRLSAPVKVQGLEDATIVSVLLSGTYLAAARTFHEILSYKTDIGVRPARPANLDQPLRPEPMESRFESPVLRKVGWKPDASDFTVQTQSQRPSRFLVPGGYVVRQADESRARIELSISESNWNIFSAKSNVEELASDNQVSITVGEPEQRPVTALSNDTAMARSLFILGGKTAVMTAKDNFWSRFGRRERDAHESVVQVGRPSKSQAMQSDPELTGSASPEPQKPEHDMSASPESTRHFLASREYVVRPLVQMELSVSEAEYQTFLARHSIEKLVKNGRVTVSVSEPELRPIKPSSLETGLARSFLICGDDAAVKDTRSIILSRIGQHRITRDSQHRQVRHVAVPAEENNDEGMLGPVEKPWIPTSPGIIGRPADDLFFCVTKIIGPHFGMLKGLLNREVVTGKIGKNLVRGQLGPKNELLLVGEMSSIEDFQSKLQQKIAHLCKTHNYGPHELERSVSAVAEVIGKRQHDRRYEVFLHGSNAEELWRILTREYVEGYRLYQTTVLHVQKAENSIIFAGAHEALSEAIKSFEQRVQFLCEFHDYPQHEVVRTRRPAHPAALEGLAERVRSTLRTLTHPVVLITSGSRDMVPVDARDIDQERDAYLLGARGVTVSSLAAVAMDPQPVVSFNLKLPSRTWDAIRSTKEFVVHSLASTPRGAAIAETFTRPTEQPHAGFLTLREMGVHVQQVARDRHPGKLTDKVGAGIEAAFIADVLLDKCIEVEDHIIVVGRVRDWSHLAGSQSRLALSYAMRGFRNGGAQIQPDYTRVDKKEDDDSNRDYLPRAEVAAAEIELDALKLGEDIDSGAIASQSREHKEETKVDEELAEDSVYAALTRTREQVRREEAADVCEAFNAEEIEHDETSPDPQPDTKDEGRSESTVSSVSTPSPTPAAPNTQITRPFSTFARRPMDILGIPRQTRRFASTFTFSDTNDLSAILDPSTAQSTVSDYLSTRDEKYKPDGHFDLYVYQSRVAHLLKNQKDITRLRELLERGYKILDNGKELPLTESEISSMNEKIISLERHVDIVLAINAHRMLREMLDKARYGEIFWRQVPEFERMVEKGMKVLMDVARELRQELEEGKVSAKDFKKISVKLKGRYEGLEREILRLRSVTEEEGDEVFDDDD
ncbi:hypothetical protein CBER1_00126 [Cercospora berteroae]|uniref:Flavin reductase like domain-containing protein n=1 Tax=Cercospora berteroae TaxID=357750 RepID=A0A2S6CD71_9PEZI|nr:hypothetical protein CBER1_00126 [Cercospora berteroae]